MAQMVPAHLPANDVPWSERAVFNALRDQLDGTWTVLHSVRWLAQEGGRSRDGEADFVLAHPDLGVLILEVKGGTIHRDAATQSWASQDFHGVVHPIKDPFQQAEGSMHLLLAKLHTATITAAYSWPVARLVAFPGLLVGQTNFGPNAPRELIIDSSDLATIVAPLRRALEQQGRGKPGPGKEGVKALVELLKPPLAVTRRGLVGEMLVEQETYITLTEQQYQLLDFLSGHRWVAINGVAGSGKTLLALEQCRRFARAGYRVFFTCYNKALAAWLREQLTADLGPAMALVTVDNYHDLAARLVEASGQTLPNLEQLASDALSHYFAEELPEQLLQALAVLPDRFDALIVDEGQDFAAAWWITLEELLQDPQDSPCYIFYDDNQRIYNTDSLSDYPIAADDHFLLTHNCRTTQAIHQQSLRYFHGTSRPDCRGPQGRPVLERPEGAAQPLPTLQKVLHELIAVEKVPLEQIVVLSARGPRTSVLKEGTRLGNLRLTWGDGGAGKVRVRSIHAFKGLECQVVILAELDRAHPANRDQLLYVALSRAQHHVVVLGELPKP